jgi:hypothetical protein
MRREIGTRAAALALALITLPAMAELTGPPAGRQQLVDALDAAWVRVLDAGRAREIVAAHDASDVVVNISDCLPRPDLTPFPAQPVGTLKDILDKRRIRVGVSAGGTLDAGASATRFTRMSEDLLAAMLNEMAANYGIGAIAAEYVEIKPPFPNTSVLNSGNVDIIGLVNALGGESEDLRRRTSRRFTCTITATGQILWVMKAGGPSWRDVNDAFNDPKVSICAGPLSNQLSAAYFDRPGQKTSTEYFSDLDRCLRRLIKGEVNAMMSPFPSERFFPTRIDVDGDGKPETDTAGLFRPIDTNIVAGTPFWVALD